MTLNIIVINYMKLYLHFYHSLLI